MAVAGSFTYSIRNVSFPSFKVIFTDTSTGSPDSWLWDFGDGHCSLEQHPTHIYRGRWEHSQNDFTPNAIEWEDETTITYTVRLTVWKSGTRIAPQTIDPVDLSIFYQDSAGHNSQIVAQNAIRDSLPWWEWTTSHQEIVSGFTYHLSKPASSWFASVSYSDADMDFSAYPVATHVAWMHWRVNDTRFGLESYFDAESYSFKTGWWNETTNAWGDDLVQAVRFGLLANEVDYPHFSLEDYLGHATCDKIRSVDAFDFERELRLGGLDYKGYVIFPDYPTLNLWSVASSDDISRISHAISTNPSIIVRPPVLFGGIKEAYFNDGWENEKHIYVEQTNPFPTIIEFIDTYAETSNE